MIDHIFIIALLPICIENDIKVQSRAGMMKQVLLLMQNYLFTKTDQIFRSLNSNEAKHFYSRQLSFINFSNQIVQKLIGIIFKYKQKNQQLHNILQQLGQGHIVNHTAENQIEEQFQDILSKTAQFQYQYKPQELSLKRKNQSFDKLLNPRRKTLYRRRIIDKEEKKRLKYEYSLAMKFVETDLSQKLYFQPERTVVYKKNFFVNLFVHWCNQHNYKIDLKNLSHLQTAITTSLKRHFPESVHTACSFKRLELKPQFIDLLRMNDRRNTLADQGKQDEESSVESKSIPSFDDDHLAQDF